MEKVTLKKILRGVKHLDYHIYRFFSKRSELRAFIFDVTIHFPFFWIRGQFRNRYKLQSSIVRPLHILCTGPSLNNSIHLLDKIPGDIMLVNGAMVIPGIEKYNVKYLVALDEACFSEKRFREVYYDWFSKKKITILAYEEEFYKYIERNRDNVSVVPIIKSLEGKYNWEKLGKKGLKYLKNGYYTIGGNSGVVSVWFALQMGYKKIFLHGLDWNLLYELKVDENNSWSMKDYPYSNLVRPWEEIIKTIHENSPRIKERKKNSDNLKVGELLIAHYHSYQELYSLKWYADNIKAEIINMSPNSGIDCFIKMKE